MTTETAVRTVHAMTIHWFNNCDNHWQRRLSMAHTHDWLRRTNSGNYVSDWPDLESCCERSYCTWEYSDCDPSGDGVAWAESKNDDCDNWLQKMMIATIGCKRLWLLQLRKILIRLLPEFMKPRCDCYDDGRTNVGDMSTYDSTYVSTYLKKSITLLMLG